MAISEKQLKDAKWFGGRWLLAELLSASPSVECWKLRHAREPARIAYGRRFVGCQRQQLSYFERQAVIATTVQNANLLPMVEADLDSQHPFFVVPWLSAWSLDRWLPRQASPSPEAILIWMARQILQALDSLHAAGYVHANLTPESILIGQDYSAYLVGLGNCELVGETLERVRRPTRFDPPEAERSGTEASSSRDIYSAGMVLATTLGESFTTSQLGQRMLALQPESRPTASQVALELLNLEHQVLGNCWRAA